MCTIGKFGRVTRRTPACQEFRFDMNPVLSNKLGFFSRIMRGRVRRVELESECYNAL